MEKKQDLRLTGERRYVDKPQTPDVSEFYRPAAVVFFHWLEKSSLTLLFTIKARWVQLLQ